MGRVKLDLPERFDFSTDIPIRIGDINYGGHLGNDAVLTLIHEARVRFLTRYGFTELDVDGPGLIMVDAVVVYKSEAFYGQTLTVKIAVGAFSRTGCDLFYHLSDKTTGREVARAKTSIAFFDYGNRRTAKVPETFKTIFAPDPPSAKKTQPSPRPDLDRQKKI